MRLAEPLKLWAPLTVELLEAGVFRLRVEARVVQVFGGGAGGFATALEGHRERAARGASRPARQARRSPVRGTRRRRIRLAERGASASGLDGEAKPGSAGRAPKAAGGASGEMLGASPAFRIRAMNVSEKMRLASRATLTERQILLRDGSPQVLMGLLANPRHRGQGDPGAGQVLGGLERRAAADRQGPPLVGQLRDPPGPGQEPADPDAAGAGHDGQPCASGTCGCWPRARPCAR